MSPVTFWESGLIFEIVTRAGPTLKRSVTVAGIRMLAEALRSKSMENRGSAHRPKIVGVVRLKNTMFLGRFALTLIPWFKYIASAVQPCEILISGRTIFTPLGSFP